MKFSQEDTILIKNLYPSKGDGAQGNKSYYRSFLTRKSNNK